MFKCKFIIRRFSALKLFTLTELISEMFNDGKVGKTYYMAAAKHVNFFQI